jgi:hypothetical protein
LGGPKKTRVQLGPFVGSTGIGPSPPRNPCEHPPCHKRRPREAWHSGAGCPRMAMATVGVPGQKDWRREECRQGRLERGRHAGHGAATPRLKAVPTEEIPRSALYGWNRSCDSAESKVARGDQGNAGSVCHTAGGEYRAERQPFMGLSHRAGSVRGVRGERDVRPGWDAGSNYPQDGAG